VLTKFRDSGFSKFSAQEVQAISRHLELNPDEPLAHLYRSFVLWSDGQIDGASEGFVRCRDLVEECRSELIGIEIGANSWMPEYLSVDELTQDSQDFQLEFVRKSEHTEAALTILVCADEAYFQRFRSSILAAAANVYYDFIIHVHLLNPSDCTVETLKTHDCPNLSITTQRTDAHETFRSYFASSRFMIGCSIINHYNTHLLTADADVFPSSNFEPIIREVMASGVDLSCGQCLRSWMPWNTHIVTKCFFRNNERGRAVLADMSAYIRNVSTRVGSYEHLWWIDQNAMHVAFTRQRRLGLSFRPIASYGQLFVGPEKIGKETFSGLISSFFRETDSFRPLSNDDLIVFLERYASALHRDEAIMLTLIYHSLLVKDTNGSEHWVQFMLFFHLAGVLTTNAFDCLVACLISSGQLSLAAACVMRGKQAVKFLLDMPQRIPRSRRDAAIEQLTPLVARQKYFRSLEQMGLRYGGDDTQTLQHFHAGVVRSHLQRGLINQAKDALQTWFSIGILVGGIQRSGTNYLAEMLRMNASIFSTYTDDNNLVFWKHALPHETQKFRCNPKFSSPVAAIKELGLHCVILYKEPVNWLDSIVNRFPADFFTSRPAFVKDERDFVGMMKFYAIYLNSWRDESIKDEGRYITLMKYEKLVSDPVSALREIPGLDGINELQTPLDLAYSRGFTKRSTSSEDVAKSNALPQEAIVEIDKMLSSRLAWMLK